MRLLLAVAATAALLAAQSADRPVTRMYVFGDSYSDTGAGYIDGNGPTAVAVLAQKLGLELAVPRDPDANSGSINFAVSGAQTGKGAGRKVKDSLLGRGMVDQVDDFVSRVNAKSISFEPGGTLFYLAGGLNDRKLPGTETVANLEGHIRKLYAVGARRFRVAQLPTAIPAFSEVGRRLNPELGRIPQQMSAELKGIDIRLSHWGEFFDRVMENPSKYGIENTKDACAGRALFDEDPTPCAKPAAWYYYHAGHPSAAVHAIVGNELYRELQASASQR
jgi:phospholipase/lecithinase/hemolysin